MVFGWLFWGKCAQAQPAHFGVGLSGSSCGYFKDVRFCPIFHFWPFLGRPLKDIRVSPHPIFSSILGRPNFFSCLKHFLAEEEAQNLEFSPHPKFWPFLGPLLGHPFDFPNLNT